MASFTFTGSATSAGASGLNYPLNTYVTLDKIRSQLSLGSQNITDDAKLLDFAWDASRAIDRYTRRFFYPLRKTNYYNDPSGETLRLDYDLLSVVGLSHMNGASEIDSSVYWVHRGDDWNLKPYDRITLNTDLSGSVFSYSSTPIRSVHLDGIWGYRETDDGWVYSGTSTTADMTTAIRSIQVGGSLGQDYDNVSPRFEAGMIIKAGSEYMMIEGGTGLSQINVRRSINGTTLASHASDTPIYTWKPEPDIATYTKRLTTWMYMQSQSPFGNERILVPGYGDINVPGTWPKDVQNGLKRFVKSPVKRVF